MTQPWCPYYSLPFLIYYPSCLFSNDSNNTPFMQNWWNVNGLTWRLLTPSFGFCIRTSSLTMFWIENRIDQYFPQVKSFLPEESLQLSYTLIFWVLLNLTDHKWKKKGLKVVLVPIPLPPSSYKWSSRYVGASVPSHVFQLLQNWVNIVPLVFVFCCSN